MTLDRNAIRLAQALYRLWRLKGWQRQQRARKAADARVKALYSLPGPKYPPRPVACQYHASRAELCDGTPMEKVLRRCGVTP